MKEYDYSAELETQLDDLLMRLMSPDTDTGGCVDWFLDSLKKQAQHIEGLIQKVSGNSVFERMSLRLTK